MRSILGFVREVFGFSVLVISLATSCALGMSDSLAVVEDSLSLRFVAMYSEGKYRDLIQVSKTVPIENLPAKLTFLVGSSYAAEYDYQPSMKYLLMAVEKMPRQLEYRYNYARILNLSGNPLGAIAQYDSIVALDSTYIPALVNLGLALNERRDYLRSCEIFQRAVECSPRNYFVHYYLASCLVAIGKADSARLYLGACLTLNPRFVPGLTLLASICFRKSEYQDAQRLYAEAKNMEPMNAELWYRIGLCQEKLQDFLRAEASFRQASHLDTTVSDYDAHRGQCFYQMKDYAAAIKAFERAAVLESDNPSVLLNIGICWAQLDSNENAIHSFQRAVSAYHPEKIGYVYEQIGVLHYNKKRYRDARNAYNEAVRYDPNNASARFFLAVSYEQLKDRPSALRGYRRYLRLVQSDSTHQEHELMARKAVKRLSAGSPNRR